MCLPRLRLGQTHTSITWLHMRILRTLGLRVWCFPVGQLCIDSECSRQLRKPDACFAHEQVGVRKCVVDSGRGSALRVCRPQV